MEMSEIMNNTEPTIATPALTQLNENDSPIIWYIDRNPTPNIIDLQRMVDNNVPNYDVYNNYANDNYNYYFGDRFQILNNNQYNLRHHYHKIYILCESLMIEDESQNCCICMETREKQDICLLNCNHGFCGICVKDILEKQPRPSCALCREKISVIRVQTSETQNNLNEYCA
jgi:hypothetical protein